MLPKEDSFRGGKIHLPWRQVLPLRCTGVAQRVENKASGVPPNTAPKGRDLTDSWVSLGKEGWRSNELIS